MGPACCLICWPAVGCVSGFPAGPSSEPVQPDRTLLLVLNLLFLWGDPPNPVPPWEAEGSDVELHSIVLLVQKFCDVSLSRVSPVALFSAGWAPVS